MILATPSTSSRRALVLVSAALAATALAALLTAFTGAHDPDLWVSVGWSAAGLVAFIGTLSAGMAATERGAKLAWWLWSVACVAWLAGVLAHSVDGDLVRGSASWLCAVVFALGGLTLHSRIRPSPTSFVGSALTVSLVAGAILFLGSGHAEDVGFGRELFAGKFALPALLLALIVLQLGVTWNSRRSGSTLILAWSGLFAAAALSWPEQKADGAIVVWTDPFWALGLLALGGSALHGALERSGPFEPARPDARETRTTILVQGLSILGLLGIAFTLRSYGDLLFWWAFIALGVFLVRVYWISRGTQKSVNELLEAKVGLEALLVREQTLRAEAERMRGELADRNARLQELDQLKNDFLALVSHELRTPLTSIIGYLELALTDDQDDSRDREYLLVVERNASRLLRLVDDLLFVARIEVGTFTLERSEVDLREIVASSLEAQLPEARRKGVELVFSAEEVPTLEGDGTRLGQLVDNLTANAIKFTPTGGQVEVGITRKNASLVLFVKDSGIGIPATELPYVFERFFRAEGANKRAIRGTGLGLSIAKAIVDAHGGQISCESEEDVGTAFRIQLPLSRRTQEARRD